MKRIVEPEELTLDAGDNIVSAEIVTLLTEDYSVILEDGRNLQDAWKDICDLEERINSYENTIKKQDERIAELENEIYSLTDVLSDINRYITMVADKNPTIE